MTTAEFMRTRRAFGVPARATDQHMPFPGHRDQARVAKVKQDATKRVQAWRKSRQERLAREYGYDPDSLHG